MGRRVIAVLLPLSAAACGARSGLTDPPPVEDAVIAEDLGGSDALPDVVFSDAPGATDSTDIWDLGGGCLDKICDDRAKIGGTCCTAPPSDTCSWFNDCGVTYTARCVGGTIRVTIPDCSPPCAKRPITGDKCTEKTTCTFDSTCGRATGVCSGPGAAWYVYSVCYTGPGS